MANVLIVDDDPATVELSRDLLESAGHQIRTGGTGTEGLLSLQVPPLPDCLLLDVEMPVLDGPGMASQMVARDSGEERIPILLVSGRNDLAAVAARMGTPYFVAKGCANYAELLLKTLRRALSERTAPSSALRLTP